jgi:hypothetical protein
MAEVITLTHQEDNNTSAPIIQSSNKPLIVKRNGKNVQVDIPQELLSQMIVYNSKQKVSVLELSQTCNVMLITLRHLRCCLCKYAIVRMAELYKVLLQCNTVPVLIHYESEEEATEYIERYSVYKDHPNRDVIYNLFRVADPTGSYFYEKLKVEENAARFLFDLGISLPKALQLEKRTQLKNPKNIVRKHWTRYPAFFIIEKGRCVNAFYSQSFGGTIDYTRALVDPEQQSCVGDVCAQSMPLEQLNEMFGVYINLANFQGKDTDVFNMFTGSGFCIKEKIANEDILPLDADSIDIQTVLQDTNMRRYFKLYAMKEMSVENLLFYESVLLYRSNQDDKTIEKEAKDIYNTYLIPNSNLEINIGGEMRKKITLIINGENVDQQIDRTLFDGIISYLESSNLSDTFNRFKRHDSFVEMIENRKK